MAEVDGNEIVTTIRLELETLRKDLLEAQRHSEEHAHKMGEQIGHAIEHGFSHAFDHLKEKVIEVGLELAAAFTFEKSIEAASEFQTAVNQLNIALTTTGTYSAESSEHLVHLAESLQLVTTAGKAATIQGEALLGSLGHLKGEGLERATRATLDFAAALQIDNETAFRLVSKAAEGNTTALTRYGIQVHATGDKARDFDRILETLEGRFKGFAELQANTFSGAMTQTKHKFDEVLESVGNLIVRSPTVIAILKAIGDEFLVLAKAIEHWAGERDVFKGMSEALGEFGKSVVLWVVAPLELAYNTAKIVFEGIKTFIQGFITGAVGALSFLVDSLAEYIPSLQGVNEALKGMATDSAAVLKQFAGETAEATDEIFNFDATAKADQYVTQFQKFIDAVKPAVKANFEELNRDNTVVLGTGLDYLKSAFGLAFLAVDKDANKFKEGLQQKLNGAFSQFATGVVTSFAAIGSALVKGENAFAAFGKALLGVLGDLAIQVGEFFVSLGVGNLLIGNPLGAAQIAAGIALVVLGGALKALSGGGGAGSSAGAASSSGGGVASGGGTGVAPIGERGQNYNEVQRGNVGTAVEVHVHGNVLDRRQTGLELAEVINELYGSNGVAFATGGQ